jgi:hypothetical protein
MFRKALLLACTSVLALGVTARADVFSTFTTLNQQSIGAAQNGQMVIQIASDAQNQNRDVSYTVNTNHASPGTGTVYTTGVIQLTNYAQNPPGVGGSFNTFSSALITGHNYNFVYALQGHAITAAPGATLTAQFDKGVLQIFDVGTTIPAASNPSTWLPAGSTSVYKATLGPLVATGIGPTGSGLAGVNPAALQNTASFVVGGNQTPGQVLLQQLTNPNTFVMPPDNIFGFQAKIQETNNATILLPTGGNAALDAAFQAAFDSSNPGFGSTTPFTTFGFNPDGTGANGDTVQTIAIQLFPVSSSTASVVPEPASMLIWAGLAAGLGIYRGVRRSRKKNSA